MNCQPSFIGMFICMCSCWLAAAPASEGDALACARALSDIRNVLTEHNASTMWREPTTMGNPREKRQTHASSARLDAPEESSGDAVSRRAGEASADRARERNVAENVDGRAGRLPMVTPTRVGCPPP